MRSTEVTIMTPRAVTAQPGLQRKLPNDTIPEMARASLAATVSLLGTLLASTSSPSNGIASSDPVSLSELAPADDYFGHQKMSPLEIRHKVFSLKDDFHHARMRPDAVQHDAETVEDAIQDWTARFPHDTWIPSAAWGLATLYEELPGTDAHEHAIVMLQFVRDHFGTSSFAVVAVRDLARGVGVRPWPRWAATPSPSPLPTAVVAIDAESLVRAILAVQATPDPQHAVLATQLETRFWQLSRGGGDPEYTRAAWELASTFERLPGESSRTEAIRLLALLVDRYPTQIYGKWAMRDLERGVGSRS